LTPSGLVYWEGECMGLAPETKEAKELGQQVIDSDVIREVK